MMNSKACACVIGGDEVSVWNDDSQTGNLEEVVSPIWVGDSLETFPDVLNGSIPVGQGVKQRRMSTWEAPQQKSSIRKYVEV